MVTLGKAGRLVIPAEFRRELGLEDGDELILRLDDEGLLVELNWKVPFGNGPVGISYRGPDSLSPAGIEFIKALRNAAKALDAS